MKNATIKDCSLVHAMERADQREAELPQVVQVREADWDTVLLAREVRRLQRIIGADDWQ